MSRNIELDNLRRNYNKKVEEMTNLRNSLKEQQPQQGQQGEQGQQAEQGEQSDQSDQDENTVKIKITDELPDIVRPFASTSPPDASVAHPS